MHWKFLFPSLESPVVYHELALPTTINIRKEWQTAARQEITQDLNWLHGLSFHLGLYDTAKTW